MRRVLIIGCPGSGKSTLAQRLAAITALPLVHLDQLYWQPGWVEPDKQQWQQRLAKALAQPTWIIDGNYGSTLETRLAAADTVVLLDLPRRLCLLRAMRRLLLSWGRIRPEMPSGCPERLDGAFLRYIWNFRQAQFPRILRDLEPFSGRTIILRSSHDVQAFLDTKASESGPISAIRDHPR